MEGSAEIGVRCGGAHATRSCSTRRCARARPATLGVGAGDRVALLLRNSIEFLEASIATVPLGASAVPINWHWRGEEIAHVLARQRREGARRARRPVAGDRRASVPGRASR